MEKNKEKKNLEDLGEFGLIDRITKSIKLKNKSSLKGVGDDAAILDYSKNKVVISTDMLIEGIHFDMTFTPLKHLGYKAVTANISDIYAMNARPKQITIGLGLSSKYTLEAIDEIYEGIYLACDKYGVDVVGGDTTSSINGLVISITAIGEGKENELTFRDGAKENDLLLVSGDLGGAYMGLTVLQREKEVWKSDPNMQPDLEGHDYILERQLKPEARKDIIDLFKELDIKPTSMIDISDGLASEIFHLCKESKVGCQLYETKIPIDPTTHKTSMDFNINPTVSALNGGEDYELLFTLNQSNYDKIKNSMDLTVIGHITKKEGGINLISNGDVSTPLKAQGWDHLSS
jgi:thiamine-monophosphate kinase